MLERETYGSSMRTATGVLRMSNDIKIDWHTREDVITGWHPVSGILVCRLVNYGDEWDAFDGKKALINTFATKEQAVKYFETKFSENPCEPSTD